MDDKYLKDQVLPAVTVQAVTFAIITALIWFICMMRACQLRREVEEYLEQHPDIEAAHNRGDRVRATTVASSDTIAIATINTNVTSDAAVVVNDEHTVTDGASMDCTTNPIITTSLAPVTATTTNSIQAVPV